MKSNISKTVKVKIAFTRTLFKEYAISFLMVCRLINFAFVVKVCRIVSISKIEFFNVSGTERVNNHNNSSKKGGCNSYVVIYSATKIVAIVKVGSSGCGYKDD